ncbi:MAG: tetratricopeptide repeat protein, partial [Pseudomonadota bacterium]
GNLATSGNDNSESLQWREEGPWLVLVLLPLAALAFRRGWLLVVPLAVLFLPPQPAQANWVSDAFKTPDQQASDALSAGEHESAAALAVDPMLRGEALYRDQQYEAAAAAFGQVNGPDGHYNRGNALAMQERYQDAIDAYDQALAMNPEMDDALHNKSVLEELLKEQEQQQQQQENSDSQDQSDGESEQQSEQPSEQEGTEESEQQAQSEESESEEQQEQTAPMAAEELDAEEKQSLEQWLRRIPDDPGGLLRRKFLLEYQRRGQPPASEEEQW